MKVKRGQESTVGGERDTAESITRGLRELVDMSLVKAERILDYRLAFDFSRGMEPTAGCVRWTNLASAPGCVELVARCLIPGFALTPEREKGTDLAQFFKHFFFAVCWLLR